MATLPPTSSDVHVVSSFQYYLVLCFRQAAADANEIGGTVHNRGSSPEHPGASRPQKSTPTSRATSARGGSRGGLVRRKSSTSQTLPQTSPALELATRMMKLPWMRYIPCLAPRWVNLNFLPFTFFYFRFRFMLGETMRFSCQAQPQKASQLLIE
jgi:hypothetical protein